MILLSLILNCVVDIENSEGPNARKIENPFQETKTTTTIGIPRIFQTDFLLRRALIEDSSFLLETLTLTVLFCFRLSSSFDVIMVCYYSTAVLTTLINLYILFE